MRVSCTLLRSVLVQPTKEWGEGVPGHQLAVWGHSVLEGGGV